MVDPGDPDAHFGAADAVVHAHGGVGDDGVARVHRRGAVGELPPSPEI